MTSTDPADVNARLDETIAIWDALHAQLDTSGHELLRRLDLLHGEALVEESDRVLTIAGRLCMQFEAPDLFRRIYAAALDGCQIAPGDELRFLRGEPRGSQPQTASAPVVVTTACNGQGHPLQVEVGGVFFSREHDQDRAWRHLRQDAISEQLRVLGGDHARALADELVDLAWVTANDEQDELAGSW